MLSLSNRDNSLLLITPSPSLQFSYTSPKVWNSIHKKVLAEPDLDLTTKISHFKNKLKSLLRSNQKKGEVND